jgi:hypothetical protein
MTGIGKEEVLTLEGISVCSNAVDRIAFVVIFDFYRMRRRVSPERSRVSAIDGCFTEIANILEAVVNRLKHPEDIA